MKLNWSLHSRVYFYMQMVIPSIFSVDKDGWCASSSVWPISNKRKKVFNDSDDEPYTKLRLRILNNTSKFQQPTRSTFQCPEKFILFPCQLPHDETIRYHSDVSVEASLEALLYTLQLNISHSIVIKSHPANLNSMKSLHKIFLKYREKYPKHLSERIHWVDKISIHTLLDKCSAVFTVNSGVGLEALLHNKPVFTFGSADYQAAAQKVIFGGSVKNAAYAISYALKGLKDSSSEDTEAQVNCRNFINNWYDTHYDTDDIKTFDKALDFVF